MQRRAFLVNAASMATVLGVAACSDHPAINKKPVVRTTAGMVIGEHSGSVAVFRGVPYAAPPVGPLRFASPRPAEPWNGVREASTFSPPFQQSVLAGSSEDGLYANVWTPDENGNAPVLVYIHGGGWMLGAGSDPTYDGSRLAARGGLVVVNFNYRLGPFGFGQHEDFLDVATGDAGNWGLQDQLALLTWVKENAAAFGGDPDNITLAGTSAGGASTWQLGLRPGTVQRIVPISACHVWNPATTLTSEDSRIVYEAMAERLKTTVRGLREVDASLLQDAWEVLFTGSPDQRLVASGREYRGPIPDGRSMAGFDHELHTPSIPILNVYTSTEGSFYTGPYSPQPSDTRSPTNDRELHECIRTFLLKGSVRFSDNMIDECIAVYRGAAVESGLPHDPLSLWTEVWGDGLFRYHNVRLAERHAKLGNSPIYLMEFAHPVRPPYFGTPHEATSPFLFGTNGIAGNVEKFGDDALEREISNLFIDSVATFAHTGAPGGQGLPAWPTFDPAKPSTMILGGEDVAQVASTPKLQQLSFWDNAGWVPTPRT